MQDLENPSATSQLESRAREQAESAKEQIRSFAEMGKEKLADQLEHVAHALKSTSEKLQSDAESEPIARYASSAGDGIERASRFLRERRAIDIVDKIEDVARSQPLVFLGGAFAFGLALGRFLKSTTPDESSFERGYAGSNITGGYPEPEEAVMTSPTTTVGDIPGGFVAEDAASFPTDRVSPPEGRGPTGNVPS